MVNLIDLARAFTPEGDELRLRQRDEEFEIRFNGWQVMSNRGSLSEKTFARLVCEGLGRRSARILIGGLGMGYTLRAALDAASPDSCVIVSELVPASGPLSTSNIIPSKQCWLSERISMTLPLRTSTRRSSRGR